MVDCSVSSWRKSCKRRFRMRMRSRVKWRINIKKASAIDSVIATGPDIIQLLKTGEKEVATDEGADAVQASQADTIEYE
jgi:hypothetical protein